MGPDLGREGPLDEPGVCRVLGHVHPGSTKSRLILPAKFREELAEGLVLTRGQERCIYVFSAREFERVHEQMRSAPLSSRQARDYIRVFLSGRRTRSRTSRVG